MDAPIAPYLYTAVRHKAITTMGRKKLQSKYLSSLSDFMDKGTGIADANIREKELNQLIGNAIATLPQKMKQIFELSKIECLSHKCIANQLNISDKTIRNQLSTALKLIKLKIVN
jgi:RNA polymerase sigma-70 factor (ECF subfamily)